MRITPATELKNRIEKLQKEMAVIREELEGRDA